MEVFYFASRRPATLRLCNISPDLLDSQLIHTIHDAAGFATVRGIEWSLLLDSFQLTVLNSSCLDVII